MGPLAGLKIVEMAGIGPAPFVGMLLSDLGADVVRIDRKPSGAAAALGEITEPNFIDRGRRSIALDLKKREGVATALELIAGSDALVEGYRPGVMERLGLGPDVCMAANPRLVYGRVTGWGQSGPLAATAGHDINYIALSGALHAIGTPEAPTPPLNLIGDFGGGAMMLAFGLMCALWEAGRSGRGQVVDAAMTDGAALLMAMIYGFKANGHWSDRRGVNWLDGGSPFFASYVCADGKFVAVGSLEPQFCEAMTERLGIDSGGLGDRWNPDSWPAWRQALAAAFAARPRDDWADIFAATDACVTPVLSLNEAPEHPHNLARAAFTPGQGGPQPAPAPRFSRTPGEIAGPPARIGAESEAILKQRGFAAERIAALHAAGVL